jgi:hypothetical protein
VVQPHCFFAFPAACSLPSAATALPFAPRQTQPSHPLQLRQFSGYSRTSRGIKLSIQRFLPCLPPDISADNLHKLQKVLSFSQMRSCMS